MTRREELQGISYSSKTCQAGREKKGVFKSSKLDDLDYGVNMQSAREFLARRDRCRYVEQRVVNKVGDRCSCINC